VLLGDADVDEPPGELLEQRLEAAAVIATVLASSSRISRTVFAKTAVYCGAVGFAAPVADTPCHLMLSSSAGP
jgi:hypothetical protein